MTSDPLASDSSTGSCQQDTSKNSPRDAQNNNNYGAGTFINVNGTQNNDYGTHIYNHHYNVYTTSPGGTVEKVASSEGPSGGHVTEMRLDHKMVVEFSTTGSLTKSIGQSASRNRGPSEGPQAFAEGHTDSGGTSLTSPETEATESLDLKTRLQHILADIPQMLPGNTHDPSSEKVALLQNHREPQNDVEQAVQLYTEILELHPPGDPARALSLSNLAGALRTMYWQSGDECALKKAIQYYMDVLELHLPGHALRDISLSNLAGALEILHLRNGAKDVLETAIQLYEEALELHPLGHPDHSISLSNLAGALQKKYLHGGNKDDLEKAIQYYRKILELHPPGDPARDLSLSNLAGALEILHLCTGAKDVLETAIQLYEEALELHPLGHPDHSISLSNLAGALQKKYLHDGNKGDLEKAIQYYRKVLDLHPPGDPARALSLSNLAGAYQLN